MSLASCSPLFLGESSHLGISDDPRPGVFMVGACMGCGVLLKGCWVMPWATGLGK